MRVLLLNPPSKVPLMRDCFAVTSKSSLYLWHPLDLLVQAGHLSGHDLAVLDCTASRLGPREAHARIDAFRPEAVLSLVGHPVLDEDLAFLETVKRKHGCVVFASGDETYGKRAAFLEEHPFVDGVLFDFVSSGFKRFLESGEVHGAACRVSGRVVVDERVDDLDYGIPRHEIFPLRRYYLPYWERPFASVYTSHGCNQRCSFCMVPGLGRPRFRPQEQVIDELKRLSAQGVTNVFFRDASFNLSAKRTEALCGEIASTVEVRFASWVKPRPLSDGLVAAMRDAGSYVVHIGIETGSDALLAKMGKGFTVADAVRCVDLFKAHGIRVVGHFLLGLEGESEASIADTLALLRDVQLDLVSVSIFEERYGTGASQRSRLSDAELKRQTLRAYRTFYLRPGRLRDLRRFVESPRHLVQALYRGSSYLGHLRLYPRFAALRGASPNQ